MKCKIIISVIILIFIFTGCDNQHKQIENESNSKKSANIKIYNPREHVYTLCDGKISVISTTNNNVVGNIQIPRLIDDFEIIDECLIFARSSKTDHQVGIIKDNSSIQMKNLPHPAPYQIEIFNDKIYISYSFIGPSGSRISVFDKELNIIGDIEIPFIANQFHVSTPGTMIVNYLDPRKSARSLGVLKNGTFRKLLSDKYKITDFAICPNSGEIIAVAIEPETQVIIIDPSSGKIKKEIDLKSKYPGNIAVNNNKVYIPHFGDDNHSPDTVSIIDLNSYELESEIKYISTPSHLIYKNSNLYVANHARGTVTVLNPATHKIIKVIKTGERPKQLETL